MWKCECGSGHLKVLLVEDNDIAAEKYGRALRFNSFEVVTVSNAAAALRKIASDRMDVVLIDLHLQPVANDRASSSGARAETRSRGTSRDPQETITVSRPR